jgi:glycosyltransferase involved in cell wall biosynthesis
MKKKSSGKKLIPFVSICTPTFNRRPFIKTMFQCFKNQTYPRNRMEWIIIDDGTDKIHDLVIESGITQIRYFQVPEKMTLGAKRNYMHSLAKGSFIVYMDDDDYYPPERVSHAVETLVNNPQALCAGSSELYIYFKHIKKMYQCGPYGPNHATAGTFAFRKELLLQTKYEDHAALAEEKAFLKNYTIPFVQLDPMKSILVFSHEHNTFDKRKLLENPHPQYFKESDKTVDMFIHRPTESAIKAFFMDDIDRLLLTYAPGEPRMKPDVLLQIKQIELEREKMQQQQQQQILMEVSGQPSVALTMPQIVDFIKKLQVENGRLMERVKEVETMSTTMQIQLLEKMQQITKLQSDLKPYREKEIKENVRIATELRDSKGSNLSEPMIESKIESKIEPKIESSDSNLSDSPLNSIKPNLSDSPLKSNLSQTWVVVEKSKFEPEIVVDCSENK